MSFLLTPSSSKAIQRVASNGSGRNECCVLLYDRILKDGVTPKWGRLSVGPRRRTEQSYSNFTAFHYFPDAPAWVPNRALALETASQWSSLHANGRRLRGSADELSCGFTPHRMKLLRKKDDTSGGHQEPSMKFTATLKSLRSHRDALRKKLGEFDRAVDVLTRITSTKNGTYARRRQMSRSARNRIAAAQKARWAKWRAQQKKRP
jgi:hypothetical protein